jgi:serine/threonine-protein phosphatase PGAM5
MARAKETAELIIKELHHSGHDMVLTEPDILLNEGLPAPIIPHRPDVGTPQQLAKEIHENHDRIEEAFQKYFYRKVPSIIDDTSSSVSSSDIDHEFEVIVCHANVIRYFVMRALQLPPEAWLRLSLFNCSITYLIVQPNGYVTARLIGDTGHIPYEATTFSGSFGYNWVGPPSVAK